MSEINKLLKELHYISINIAEARCKMADMEKQYPDKAWKNVALALLGANTNTETAIAEIHLILEGQNERD